MFSFIPTAACILRKLADIVVNIYSCFFSVSSFPPRVPSLLAGFDNGLLFAMNPSAFLSRCQHQCGPVYRVSLGSWSLLVVSSGDAISSVFSVSPQLLQVDTIHEKVFHIICGFETSYPHIGEVTTRELFPFFDRSFSSHSLGQTSRAFGLALLSQIKDLTRDINRPISLMELTNEPLFTATNYALFGSAFPADIYRDFQTLNKSIPYRFSGTLLSYWPSYTARKRLLKSLEDYLQRRDLMDCDNPFSRGFMKIIKDNNIQPREGAKVVLNFLWGAHTNALNNSFFSLIFLLNDPDGFMRVRAEIDSAVDKFGGLEELLQADPSELDDPSFRLLTSAIMETMRLTSMFVMRQAACDFDLKLNDGTTIPIQKGENVFANVQAAHMDKIVFPNPETFEVDRFAQHPYRRKRLQTEGHFFHSLGGGKHVCKGRWLAIYEIKVLLIILFRMFDFSPGVESSTGWCLPRIHPRSVVFIHTEDEVFARLSLRQAGNKL